MSDFLVELGQNPNARKIIQTLGLPIPMPQTLARETGPVVTEMLVSQTVLVGGAPNGRLSKTLLTTLNEAGAEVSLMGYGDATSDFVAEGEKLGNKPTVYAPHSAPKNLKAGALVFDATGLQSVADADALYGFFHDVIRSLGKCGRVVILGGVPEDQTDVATRAVVRGLVGFTKSIAKEVGKKGSTANLIQVGKGAESRVPGALRYFLSNRSAFVSGQTTVVEKLTKAEKATNWDQSLAGKVALVTGAARGIGAATAAALAAEGAKVVCLDLPHDRAVLAETVAKVDGFALELDITATDAPDIIADTLNREFGGVDIVVHNAGVTRDRTIAKMDNKWWNIVMQINLQAIINIDAALTDGVLNEKGRIVALSSIGGIAGNVGQTNYALTKAAVIGYVKAQAEKLAAKGIGVNAVAPGFIETRMTAQMPFGIREAGRRLSALGQGGQPEDVADLITFLSTPAAAGITGQVVRVCGLSLVGA